MNYEGPLYCGYNKLAFFVFLVEKGRKQEGG